MFKTFPEFSKLTLADRHDYEALVKDYPPIDDISFTSLMTWWSSLENTSVSRLNGNLVISYCLPGEDKFTGLSLVGTNDVDESICAIFDYLREKGEPLRLVNVPEFVISNAAYPAMFNFKEQRALHEYILPLSGFYPSKT